MKSSLKEIYADKIVSPLRAGGLAEYSPGRICFDRTGIKQIERIAKSKLSSLSRASYRAKLITPGLIDAHTHLVFAGSRADEWNLRLKGATYQEIAKAGGGIKKTVESTRSASFEELKLEAVARLKRAVKLGITSLEVKSGYGLSMESELKILKVIREIKDELRSVPDIQATFMGAHTIPKEFKNAKSYVDFFILNVLKKVRGLARFQDVFTERGYFGAKDSIRLLDAGKKYGLLPKVHAHEFGRTGGVDVAVKVGAVSADHLMAVNESDMHRLKTAGVIPVLLPGTSLFLGAKKFAPARRMWDLGLRPAIASDFNPGTNPTQNLPLVGTFSAIFTGLNLDEILIAQTWHAALALALRDRGRLERGLRADLACWNYDSFEEIYYRYGDIEAEQVFISGVAAL